MMTINEFTNYVVLRIKDYLPPSFQDAEVELHEVLKDDGNTHHGVSLHLPDKKVSPLLYIEDMYNGVASGKAVTDVMQDTADLFVELFQGTDILTEKIYTKASETRNHIFFKLIQGKDLNTLKNFPHQRIENLIKIYFWEPFPRCQEKITYRHLKQLGMDLQELDTVAQQNSMEQKPAELMNLSTLCSSEQTNLLEGEETLPMDLYVLTNAEKNLGASVICYPGLLARVGERLGEDFYVLPSSIDEVMILPKSAEISAKRLGEVVREVNATAVAEGRILSNCAYEYSRERGTLAIVPGSRERNFKEQER